MRRKSPGFAEKVTNSAETGQNPHLRSRMPAMGAEMIILVLLIATALAFDFTNGFHDTGNAMATSIATRALRT